MEYKSFIGDMNTGDSSMELENGQVGKGSQQRNTHECYDNLAQSCNNHSVMTANSLSCLQ